MSGENWRRANAQNEAAERKERARKFDRGGLVAAVKKGINGENGPDIGPRESKLPIWTEVTAEADEEGLAAAIAAMKTDAGSGSETRQNRLRALEICRCFDMIAQDDQSSPVADDGKEYLIHRDDLDPLASALREGRLDLIELAMSARRCQVLPILLQKPDAPKAERVVAVSEIGKSKDGLEAMKWAAFLFLNGWFSWEGIEGKTARIHKMSAHKASAWAKCDILAFLETVFPNELAAAIPTGKRELAAFWKSIGAEGLKKGNGELPTPTKDALHSIRGTQRPA